MRLITPSSLVLGLVLSSPALWVAFSEPGADITGALLRFVLAVLVAGAGLSFVRGMVAAYQVSAIRTAQEASNTITTLPQSHGTVLVASDDVLPA